MNSLSAEHSRHFDHAEAPTSSRSTRRDFLLESIANISSQGAKLTATGTGVTVLGLHTIALAIRDRRKLNQYTRENTPLYSPGANRQHFDEIQEKSDEIKANKRAGKLITVLGNAVLFLGLEKLRAFRKARDQDSLAGEDQEHTIFSAPINGMATIPEEGLSLSSGFHPPSQMR